MPLSQGAQRSFLAKTLDVFGAGLGRHLRLALDHDADLLDYLGVGKRSDVANAREKEHPEIREVIFLLELESGVFFPDDAKRGGRGEHFYRNGQGNG